MYILACCWWVPRIVGVLRQSILLITIGNTTTLVTTRAVPHVYLILTKAVLRVLSLDKLGQKRTAVCVATGTKIGSSSVYQLMPDETQTEKTLKPRTRQK